jgi:hypothetical protein
MRETSEYRLIELTLTACDGAIVTRVIQPIWK